MDNVQMFFPRSRVFSAIDLGNSEPDLTERGTPRLRRPAVPRKRANSKGITPLNQTLWTAFYAAQADAIRKSRSFNLTEIGLAKLIERCAGRCELSGIKFNDQRWGTKRPFIPSIDRINAKEPYSVHNCRIVCWAINLALSDWGDAVLELIIAIGAKKRGWTPPSDHEWFQPASPAPVDQSVV